MITKKKAIDLVVYKDGQRIAFEIETGENSKEQFLENISKCLNNGVDKIYLIATNNYAYEKIEKLLIESGLMVSPEIFLHKTDTIA